MLNPFPIQFLALLAYFILRVVVGLVLLWLGYRHYRSRQELYTTFRLSWFPFSRIVVPIFIAGELILGVMFIIGWNTQIAALFTLIMSTKMLIMRSTIGNTAIPPRIFYVLLAACALSLFITGAGVFAFDLPI